MIAAEHSTDVDSASDNEKRRGAEEALMKHLKLMKKKTIAPIYRHFEKPIVGYSTGDKKMKGLLFKCIKYVKYFLQSFINFKKM